MRGLASFVMSGRYRALLVAVASSGSLLFGWIGAAVVALVTLRRGYREGLWLLLWALLPAVVLTRVSGDSSALALLLGTGVLALLLRATVSLTLTTLASGIVGALTGLGLLVGGQELLAELARVFEEFFRTMSEQAQRSGGAAITLQPPTTLQLAGMMGAANATLSFLCLALARYWQAALYNPGGFGAEFRALRIPPLVVGALLVGALAVASLGFSYRSWAALLLLPLSVAGFALLHARARLRGRGSFWLGGLYAAWAVFDAIKLALLALVALDALIDLRRRWGMDMDGSDEARRPNPCDNPAGRDDSDQADRDSDRDDRDDRNGF